MAFSGIGASAALAAEAPFVPAPSYVATGQTTVSLGGFVNPKSSEVTECHFEWGATEGYGETTPCTKPNGEPVTIGSGTLPVQVSGLLTGLAPGTTYHVRLVATNGIGTTASADAVFMTFASPTEGICANEARRSEQHATFLPDCRAYEMVSPADKNGAGIFTDTGLTRASADGDALSYPSLGAFGEIFGTDIGVDYIAERSTEAEPGDNGWHSHAITPSQLPKNGQTAAPSGPAFAVYQGEMSPDLSSGIVPTFTPLTDDPNVAGVANLYRRTDLLGPGKGTYELLSTCPLCEETAEPLAPTPLSSLSANMRPYVNWTSPDLSDVIFESEQLLTADAPEAPGCDFSSPLAINNYCRAHLYEGGDGTTRLAGRVPVLPATSCDDEGGPACVPADVSIAGQGVINHGLTGSAKLTLHTVSDGSDGHTRTFFTQPTNASGETSEELGNSAEINGSSEGRLFMRVDGTSTVQINATQRVPAAPFVPSAFMDASVDGRRAFFKSSAQLTNDAGVAGGKLYMYEVEPHSAVQSLKVSATGGTFNLTFEGQTTADLPFNASAAEVQSALNGLASVGGVGGAVSVSGGPGTETGSSPYVVVFGGLLANQPVGQIAAADGATPLSGGSPSSTATVTTTASGGHLTLLSPDRETSDGANVQATIGASADGSYVYFTSTGQLVAGQPRLGTNGGIYLWHEGTVTYVGRSPKGTAESEIRTFKANPVLNPYQARVTADGRHLLFATTSGVGVGSAHGLVDFDQGSCLSAVGVGCRELYLYSAGTNTIQCVSCPREGVATEMATVPARANQGAAESSFHITRAVSADGRYAFFSTPQALVTEDTNGTYDAYEFDLETGEINLLSSGTSEEPSYFLDASPDGHSAFISTTQRLLSWDVDSSYDVYSVRVDGGFPEPKPVPASCEGEACRPGPAAPPVDAGNSSSTFTGQGNRRVHRPKHRRGNRHSRKHHKRHTHNNRRTSR